MTIAELAVSFSARTKKFRKGVRSMTRRLKRFGRSVAATARSAAIAFAAIGAAALAAGYMIFRFVNNVTSQGDRIAKTAKTLGMTAEQVSSLAFAAERSGSEFEIMKKGLAQLARNAGYAQDGLATYTREFDKLGVVVDDGKGGLKDLNTLFIETAEALSKMEDKTQRLSIAKALFGRGGQELMPLLAEGEAGIRRLREESDRLGGTWSGIQARMAEVFQDRVQDMKTAWNGLVREIVIGILPAVTVVVNGMTRAFVWMRTEGLAIIKDWVTRVAMGFVAVWSSAEVAVTRWRDILELAMARAHLTVHTWVEDVKHAFTGNLWPRIKWFAGELVNVFQNMFVVLAAQATNFVSNFVTAIKRLPDLLRGTISLDDIWATLPKDWIARQMTQGIGAMPVATERAMTAAEKMLSATIRDLESSIGSDFDETFNENWDKLTGWWEKIKDELSEGMGDRDFESEFDAAAGDRMTRPGAAERGSVEAYRATVADPRYSALEKINNQIEKNTGRAASAAEETARNTANSGNDPVVVAF